MREPFFNDVSITPLCSTDDEVTERINEFVDILEFCGFLGFKKVRFNSFAGDIELKKGFFVRDYLAVHARGNGNRALLLLNMLKPPYIEDDSVAEERYISHTARLKKDGVEIESEGLASALFSNGFSIGFASEEFWRQNISFALRITEDATQKCSERKVFCISCLSHFKEAAFIKWSVDSLPLQFRSSDLQINAKRIKLRQDHGIKELGRFSEAIRKEPYIIEVVNSLPFDPNSRKMTKLKEDGLIEVRLLNTQNKIGIIVRTTARNEMESMYLAADIEKKYA